GYYPYNIESQYFVTKAKINFNTGDIDCNNINAREITVDNINTNNNINMSVNDIFVDKTIKFLNKDTDKYTIRLHKTENAKYFTFAGTHDDEISRVAFGTTYDSFDTFTS